MVGLGSREEEVYLSVLMLEDYFCTVFVGEDSEDWIIGFMLHDNILIFNVIVFQS